jgi:hypothetical protein
MAARLVEEWTEVGMEEGNLSVTGVVQEESVVEAKASAGTVAALKAAG